MSKKAATTSNLNMNDSNRNTGENGPEESTPKKQTWDDFMADITRELDTMNEQLESVCKTTHRSRRTRSPRSPRTPKNKTSKTNAYVPPTPTTINKKLVEELERRRNESPSTGARKRPIKEPEREIISNYKFFPSRKNASARIFKPDKLKFEVYRNPKKVVPVLTGSTIRLSDDDDGAIE